MIIIAFVLATIKLLIFFDGIIRRTHPIANKKSTKNTHNLQIQILSVKLSITFAYSELRLSVLASSIAYRKY